MKCMFLKGYKHGAKQATSSSSFLLFFSLYSLLFQRLNSNDFFPIQNDLPDGTTKLNFAYSKSNKVFSSQCLRKMYLCQIRTKPLDFFSPEIHQPICIVPASPTFRSIYRIIIQQQLPNFQKETNKGCHHLTLSYFKSPQKWHLNLTFSA